MLPQHHIFSKTGFFDASYRLPLIVRDPRPTADAGRGQTVEAFTEAVVRRARSLLASGLHFFQESGPVIAAIAGIWVAFFQEFQQWSCAQDVLPTLNELMGE